LAVLRRKVNGNYIILGPDFPGMPTRQIQPEGVEWLRQKGIILGNQVPRDLIQLLEDNGWVWTYGEPSTLSSPPGPDEPTDDERELLSFLEQWSRDGDPRVFERELGNRRKVVSLHKCFDKAFLSWVVAIQEAITPLQLCDLTLYEIQENFFRSKVAQFSRLHRQLWDRERGKWVICHWLIWISEVYLLSKQGKPCPDLWQGRVHGVIYRLLADLDEIQVTPLSNLWKRNKSFIRWNFREGMIELVFPEQKGPENCRIEFDLNGILQTLKLEKVKGACRWKEEVFRIDEPEPPIFWEFSYYRNEELYGKIFSRFPGSGILLWDETGIYLEPETQSGKLLSEKHYYLLAHNDRKTEIASLGIILTSDNELLEPVGWWDWVAFHIFIPGSVEKLGPYPFQRPELPLSIELSTPPQLPVEFAHQVPVYLGDWPLCRFDDMVGALSAKLVIVGDACIHTHQFPSQEGRSLNLNAIDALKHHFGLATLEFSALSPKGRDRQEMQFMRLPAWAFNIIDDPGGRSVKALSVSGVFEGSMASGANCEVIPGEQGHFVITAQDPCRNPVVTVSWQNRHDQGKISFSVRLPVNRGTILRYGAEFPSWQGLPLTAPSDFLASTREGEIRLELLHPHPHREVWVKASGEGAVQCGQLLGRVVRLPCHRIRDYLGTRFATLFVETAGGWEPFLNQAERPELPPSQSFPPEIDKFTKELWWADRGTLQNYWDEAQVNFIEKAETHPIQDSLLVKTIFLAAHLGDWFGIKEFFDAVQIPEAEIIKIRRHLRIDLKKEQDLKESRRWVEALPPDSYKTHAEGEWWYRFARQRNTMAPGALATSYHRLSDNIWGDPVSAVEAFSLSSMSALLGSGEIPSAYPNLQSPYYQLFSNIYNWLSTELKKIDQLLLPPEIPYPLEYILVPQDILFLSTCIAQMRREVGLAGQLLSQLEHFSQQFPISFLLLKARQYRFSGFREQAVSVYRELMNLSDIPDRMLQVILNETNSW
jgi:hypothetical protein